MPRANRRREVDQLILGSPNTGIPSEEEVRIVLHRCWSDILASDESIRPDAMTSQPGSAYDRRM